VGPGTGKMSFELNGVGIRGHEKELKTHPKNK